MYHRLEKIFASFLGDSARGVSNSGQVQYPCPFCSSGKTNLECNFPKGVYSSWCCPEKSGRLSKLIKEFGNEDILKNYYQEIKNIRESYLYQLHFDNHENFGEILFELPKCCIPVDKNLPEHREAYQYLIRRGLSDDDIRQHKIHCTGNACSKCTKNCKYGYKLQNRIIFVNYNFGVIDYWTGRLYRESKYQTKYLLPADVNKRDIIWGYDRIQFDGQVRLCEGIFDSYTLPNTIPVLGKKLNLEFRLFNVLLERANSICLIPDNEEAAYRDFLHIKNELNSRKLKNKISIVHWDKLDLKIECKDISDLYKNYGKTGIINLLKTALS